jgi:hypothetical protein
MIRNWLKRWAERNGYVKARTVIHEAQDGFPEITKGPSMDAVFFDPYEEIVHERQRQIDLGYTFAHDDAHSMADFATFVRLRIGATWRSDGGPTREQWVQIAALAVAAIESHDRRSPRGDLSGMNPR